MDLHPDDALSGAVAIVEDDHDDFAALARVLSLEHVVHWQSASHALESLKADQPLLAGLAVLVVDLGLPDMHGTELIRTIRALPGGQHPAIFALTGSDAEPDRRAAAAAGADDYYVKPETVAGLRGIAARIADVTAASTTEALRVPRT